MPRKKNNHWVVGILKVIRTIAVIIVGCVSHWKVAMHKNRCFSLSLTSDRSECVSSILNTNFICGLRVYSIAFRMLKTKVKTRKWTISLNFPLINFTQCENFRFFTHAGGSGSWIPFSTQCRCGAWCWMFTAALRWAKAIWVENFTYFLPL